MNPPKVNPVRKFRKGFKPRKASGHSRGREGQRPLSYGVKIKFAKFGPLRYISHLDLVRLFHRALRRAEIPVQLTGGFSPRLKVSIRRALKVGKISFDEEMVITLREYLQAKEIETRLKAQLPEGIKILDVGEL